MKEGEIDALRNDNYILANRNMRLFMDLERWAKVFQDNLPEEEVGKQMIQAVDLLRDDIADNYT